MIPAHNPETMSELTWIEWRALALVNEKAILTEERLCHLMYGRQTALPRTKELIEVLKGHGLIEKIHSAHYVTSEKGDEYIENATKPAPPLK